MVNILNKDNEHVGGAVFKPKEDNAVSGGVVIGPDYQKKGLGTELYKFVSELGNDITPSEYQLPAGKAMWDSFARSGMVTRLHRSAFIAGFQNGALKTLMRYEPANQPPSAKPATALESNSQRQWRGLAEPRR